MHNPHHKLYIHERGKTNGLCLWLFVSPALTGDGASNNKKAAKELGLDFEVCGPHNLQRTAETGVGHDKGKKKPSSNPEVAQLLKRNARMASVFKTSNVAVKRLSDAQVCPNICTLFCVSTSGKRMPSIAVGKLYLIKQHLPHHTLNPIRWNLTQVKLCNLAFVNRSTVECLRQR